MVKRAVEELKAHKVPGCFGCTVMRVHGKEEIGVAEFWIGVFILPPGDGTEYAYEGDPSEKVYYVLEGEATVKDNEGSIYTIHKDEPTSFKLSEGRYLKGEGNLPARMLVIINYPEA